MSDTPTPHFHNWQLVGGNYRYTPTGKKGDVEFNCDEAVFTCECGEWKVNKPKQILIKKFYK